MVKWKIAKDAEQLFLPGFYTAENAVALSTLLPNISPI